jgi:hypothetical protein
MIPRCPHCHKPLVGTRAGVRLTALKAKIFDAIVAAGDAGLTAREIMVEVYRGRELPADVAVIRNHIMWINKLLGEVDCRIKCKKRRWFVENAPQGRRAAQEFTASASEV